MVDDNAHLAAVGQIARQAVLVEAVLVARKARVHHLKQGILVDDIAFERGDAFAIGGAVEEDLLDKAVFADNIAVGQAVGQLIGADRSHRVAAAHMLFHQRDEIDVGAQIAEHQHDVLLGNVADVLAHGVESFHRAGVVALVVLGQTERRQDAQAAGLAVEIPGLAAADVVEQGLIIALHDDADVADAGIDHGGEGQVDQAVAAAEGQRSRRAVGDEITQSGVGAIGEDNSVKI